jgi:serine/threonine-protein kinase
VDNPVVVAVLVVVVVGLAALLARQRARAAKSTRGEIDGLDELLKKGRYGEAAQLALRHDRFAEAIDLYLRGNEPARAAQLAARIGNHRQAGELYERAGDPERAAAAYEKAGMGDRSRDLRGAAKAAPKAAPADDGDLKARAREAEERFLALRAKAGGDPAGAFEVQQEATRAAEALIAVGEVARAADLYRDADMVDEAVHLYVNVLGAPGSAAPLVAARGFHERAAELYEIAGMRERAAMAWGDLARSAKDPDRMLDRVEGLSLVVAKSVLRDLTRAKPLTKATAPLHYRYGTVLERDGEVDRAIEVFQAMQAGVGNYRDIELRVRRLARGEGVSMKAPGVPRDLLKTAQGTFAVASPADAGLGLGDASRMVRDAAYAAVARARRASSLPPPVEAKPAAQPVAQPVVHQVVHVTHVVVPGRPGHPDRTLARGLEESPIGLGALYDGAVRGAKDGPSVEALEQMIAGRPCDLGNIEVFYRLGLAALASGDWPRAQECFAAVEDASPGYRDAGGRVLELAGWQSMLARRMSVVGAQRPAKLDAMTGRYEVKGELGRGGMAVVYRATDTVLGREVALKFLAEELGARPEMREMFQREARSVAQLNHPNIVTIHDSGVVDGRMFMAMELVEGRSIDAIIDAEGRIAVLEALRVARQVLEALEFAHGRQIIHRDVKPSNMMRSTAGHVKLMDFGLAKALTGDLKSSVIAGTPAYMPPEQLVGVGVDSRSDLFAVGATLYEMLTGQLPFQGFDRKAKPKPLREITPNVPEMIEKMVLQALDPDPSRRFQSATDFLVPIKRVLAAVEKVTRGSGPTAAEADAPAAEVALDATDARIGPPPAVARPDPALTVDALELPVPEESIPDGGFIDFDNPPSVLPPPEPEPAPMASAAETLVAFAVEPASGVVPAPAAEDAPAVETPSGPRPVQATLAFDPLEGLGLDDPPAPPAADAPAPPAADAPAPRPMPDPTSVTGTGHAALDPDEFDPTRRSRR